MKTLARFASLYILPAVGLLSALSPALGQTVTAAAASRDLGSVNVCAPGTATPAPCTASLTASFNVTASGTLGTPKVLTWGAPNLDYTLASANCSGSVSAGACTVTVAFTPKFPGVRSGAVEIVDTAGHVLATTLLGGIGLGPQIAFDNITPVTLASTTDPNAGWWDVAVDGAGNAFVATRTYSNGGFNGDVFELPAGSATPVSLGVSVTVPLQMVVDGAGALYVVNSPNLVKIPAGCTSSLCQTTIALPSAFSGLAIDSAGAIYAGTVPILKFPAGCTNVSCATSIAVGSNDYPVNGILAMALDSARNLYILDQSNILFEQPAGSETFNILNSFFYYSETMVADAGGSLYLNDSFGGGASIFSPVYGTTVNATSGSGYFNSTILPGTSGVALDGAGNVYATGFYNGSGVYLAKVLRNQAPPTAFNSTVLDTVSSDSPASYIVQSTGNQPLSLATEAVTNYPNFAQVPDSGYLQNCASGLLLAPQSACGLNLEFSPAVAGPLTGSAVLMDNTLNAVGATQTIPLSGTGIAPAVYIPFTPAEVTVSGGAALVNHGLRLTDGGRFEARSAFITQRQNVSAFTTNFSFQVQGPVVAGQPPTPANADGFAFVLQSNGPDALGSYGSGLGYGPPALGAPGPSIGNSVAIKFDLHNNDGEGSSSTGLYLNGASPTVPAVSTLPSGLNLHSGPTHIFNATLVYDGSTLTLTLADPASGTSFTQAFKVDIPAILGGTTGYVGFTGSTGMQSATQDILQWQYSPTACCAANEPAFVNGFTGASGLALNGGAAVTAPALELAAGTAFEASSAYFTTAVPVGRFTSDFDFQISSGIGDGFTFVLQSQGLTATGLGGGGLGYGPSVPNGGGAKIANSVAVKFDLHNNFGEGSDSTGVYIDGASPTVPATNLAPSGINLQAGHAFHARIVYDGTNLKLILTDLTRYAVFTGTFPVDIPSAVGGPTAYAGFTAGTGASFDTIKILNWQMTTY